MIDAHRAAFEYDWRTRFSQEHGLAIVGTKRMSWGEALRLTERLMYDPSSHACAAVGEWERPTPTGDLVTMELYDLEHHIAWVQGGKKGARPKPYPRPWPQKTKRRLGPDHTVTQDAVVAALRAAGHDGVIPLR